MNIPQEISVHNEQQWNSLVELPSHIGYVLISTDHLATRDQVLEQLIAEKQELRHIAMNLVKDPVASLAQVLRDRIPEDILSGEKPKQAIHCLNLETSRLFEIVKGEAQLLENLETEAEAFTNEFPLLLVLWTDVFMLDIIEQQAPNFFAGAMGRFSFFSEKQDEELKNPYSLLTQNIHALSGESDASTSAKMCQEIAEIFEGFGQPEEAMNYYHQSLEYAQQCEDKARMASAYLRTADLLKQEGDLIQALDAYQFSLENFQDIDNWEEAGAIHRKVADIQKRSGNLSEAMEQYKAAIYSFKQTDKQEEIAITHRYIGQLLERKGDLPKSIKYYETAIELFDTPAEKAKTYQQIGAIHQDQLRWAEALDTFKNALPFAKKAEDKFLIEAIEDSIENMEEEVAKKEKKGKKGLFGKLFG